MNEVVEAGAPSDRPVAGADAGRSGGSFDGTISPGPSGPSFVERLWRYRVLILSSLASLAGLVVAYRLRPIVFVDDAAITARYAERIATGHGWTYNDGDRTNGASAPLYTMVLAALRFAGLDTIDAIRYVGTALFALTVGLVAYLGSRIGGLLAGALGATLILTWTDFQVTALAGMESILAAALGLGVAIAVLHERDAVAGVLLGLAVVNKLDAGFLAVAVALAYLVVLRRPPWRTAAVAAVVAAPWFLFATIYFGSPLPYSMTQKVGGTVVNAGWDHHVGWIWDGFVGRRTVPLVLLAVAAALVVPWLARRRPAAAAGLAICVAWPAVHALVFSVVSLGDAYLWYVVVLYPPMAVAAAVAVTVGIRLVVQVSGVRPRALRQVTAIGLVGLVLVLLNAHNSSVVRTARDVRHGREPTAYESFEYQRRQAALYLSRLVEPGDIILTCWGWVAYESIENPIAEECPLNTRKRVGWPRWYVPVAYPVVGELELSEDDELMATFATEAGQGGHVYVVRFGSL